LPATAPTHHEYADHARQALRIFDEFYTVDDARLKTELARALGLVEVSAPTGFINIGEETMPGNNAKLNNIIVGTTGVVGGATGATAGAISAAGGAATTGGVLAALKAAPVAAACGAAAGVVAGGFLFAGAAKLTINAVNYCFMDEIPAPAVRVAAPVAMPAPVPVALPAPAPVSLPAPVVAAESEAINGLVSSLREMHGLLNDIREERRERDVTAVPAIPASAAPAPAVPAPIPEVEALRLELADTRAASQRQAVEFSAMKEQLAQLMALLARNATNNAPQEADGADAATLPVPRAGGPALLLMSGRDDAIPEADGDELVA